MKLYTTKAYFFFDFPRIFMKIEKLSKALNKYTIKNRVIKQKKLTIFVRNSDFTLIGFLNVIISIYLILNLRTDN